MRYQRIFACGTTVTAAMGGEWDVAYQSERCRINELEADQRDWRNGVELIAAAVNSTGPGYLSCAHLAERILEIRAERESDGLIDIVVRKKDSSDDWKPMSAIPVKSTEDARQHIRNRSDVMDKAFDFAIRVTTIRPFDERSRDGEIT